MHITKLKGDKMANYKVEITGINTNNLKVLKSEETIELFKKYQAGDSQAKEEIVNGNLKLVLSILKKFNNQKYNLDDLTLQICTTRDKCRTYNYSLK